jgi:hypothetical protein
VPIRLETDVLKELKSFRIVCEGLPLHSLYGIFIYELKLIVFGDVGYSKSGWESLLGPWSSFSIEKTQHFEILSGTDYQH